MSAAANLAEAIRKYRMKGETDNAIQQKIEAYGNPTSQVFIFHRENRTNPGGIGESEVYLVGQGATLKEAQAQARMEQTPTRPSSYTETIIVDRSAQDKPDPMVEYTNRELKMRREREAARIASENRADQKQSDQQKLDQQKRDQDAADQRLRDTAKAEKEAKDNREKEEAARRERETKTQKEQREARERADRFRLAEIKSRTALVTPDGVDKCKGPKCRTMFISPDMGSGNTVVITVDGSRLAREFSKSGFLKY